MEYLILATWFVCIMVLIYSFMLTKHPDLERALLNVILVVSIFPMFGRILGWW